MKKLPLPASKVYEEYYNLSRGKKNMGEFDIKCPITVARGEKWPCNAYAVVYESLDEYKMMRDFVLDQEKLLDTILPMADALDRVVVETSKYIDSFEIRSYVEQTVKMQIKTARAKLIDDAQTVGYKFIGQNRVKPTEDVFSIEVFKNGQRVLLGFATSAELASEIGSSEMVCHENVGGALVRDIKLRGVDAVTRFDTIERYAAQE